jgi:predicted ATPase
MIGTIQIESFKSLESLTIDIGQVNVFIGGNGSGKSNLLEAIGVLSAAADGKVTDQTLMQRGVRPGVPRLYKSAFEKNIAPHIHFAASNPENRYEIDLQNPLKDPKPAWRFKTEKWEHNKEKIVGNYPAMNRSAFPEQGIAALKLAERLQDDPALFFLKRLQNYVIYSPTTPVLRGISPEIQPRHPVGLTGGRLPEAIMELSKYRRQINESEEIQQQILSLIDWASSYSAGDSITLPLSPSASTARLMVKFRDKYMREKHNILSGYDASEGALYILFLAVLAVHPESPEFFAIDNADHGLNPRLACELSKLFCKWIMDSPGNRQVLITSHNPAVLDGLPLGDDRVRLFTVDRDNKGHTVVKRIEVTDKLLSFAEKGWTMSRLWMNKLIGGVPNV